MNVVLIGFKGCGKSAVGKLLAKALDREFLDLDRALEKIHEAESGERLTFREIYLRHGVAYFRRLEEATLTEVMKADGLVVALGGGTLFASDSIQRCLHGAFCVHIHVDPDVLFQRIMKNGLPAFFDPDDPRTSFDKYYRERLPRYVALAHFTADNTPEDVAGLVEQIRREVERPESKGS